MRLGFDFDERAAREFAGQLRALGARAENVRPALEAVADDFLEMERGAFSSRGRSIGARWAPLRAGLPAPDLVASGSLRAALTSGHGPGSVRRFTADSVTMGVHKDGLPRPRFTLLKVRPRDATRWRGIVAEHLFGADRGML